MTDPEIQMTVPQGRFSVRRLPRRRRELLRAWDAADEYLLHFLAGDGQAGTEIADTGWGAVPALDADARLLIVNDGFGALAVALAAWRPQAWSDSFLSQAASVENLADNGLADAGVSLIDSLAMPQGPFDGVLIKAPKTLALLEDQLIRLRPLLTPDTRVIVAGMVKGLPNSVWPLLERIVGPTSTSRAWKKARLILATPDPALPLPVNPYPIRYRLEGTDYELVNHANVFSRDSLDIGTRFLLQHLPVMPQARDIVDLGCGNGVVGLLAAASHPDARLHFVDESFMAVASARENFAAAFGARTAEFRVGDGLNGYAAGAVDLVLCNPPFHQQQAVGDQIALSMFRQAHRTLRPGGELWVIGNRHLGYHVPLKRLFGQVELVASNRKFVILRARRSLESD